MEVFLYFITFYFCFRNITNVFFSLDRNLFFSLSINRYQIFLLNLCTLLAISLILKMICSRVLLNITAGDCHLTRIRVEFWAELKMT
ncbi:hypothetical protein C1646_272014 [Rhizophagus diaphanus]|nr:hypothetical protein C1646_272014 [Rhizophagus diaphanus] [Rhizophagus sp. MUCL 43196]